jgi:hypothetical protein
MTKSKSLVKWFKMVKNLNKSSALMKFLGDSSFEQLILLIGYTAALHISNYRRRNKYKQKIMSHI